MPEELYTISMLLTELLPTYIDAPLFNLACNQPVVIRVGGYCGPFGRRSLAPTHQIDRNQGCTAMMIVMGLLHSTIIQHYIRLVRRVVGLSQPISAIVHAKQIQLHDPLVLD